MPARARKIHLLPDAERVQEALLAAAQASRFVDASQYATFAQLVDWLEGAQQLQRRACSPLTCRILLHQIARELGSGPYGAFVQEPAFARGALEVILELKAGQMSPSDFSAAVEALAASRLARGRFLARLYAGYEAKMASLKLADREDLARGAIEGLRRRGLPPRLRASAIEVSHLHDFPPLRIELLLTLAAECDRLGIPFRIEVPAAGSGQVDAIIDPLLAEFERRGQSFRHVDLEKSDFTGDRPLAALGPLLFSPDEVRPKDELGTALKLFSAATEREEARLLARCALDFVQKGTPADRIAIAFRELGEEAEWVIEALQEVGLGARVRRGAPLGSTSAGRLALDLPLLVDNGFPAEQVAPLLASRYAPALSDGLPESPESLLRLAAVRDDIIGAEGRRGAYEVRLELLAKRLEAKLGGRPNPAQLLLDRCRKLIELLRRIPEESRCLELLRRWWLTLEELGFFRAVRRSAPREEEETGLGQAVLSALARDQAAAEALQILAAELEGALKLAGAGAGLIHRRTFHRVLVDAAADFNLLPRELRGAEVQVLDLRELPGRRFAKVLIGGAADGRFPLRKAPHQLLSDEDRAAVNEFAGRAVFRLGAGDGNAAMPWRLGEDRLLLYLALCSADEEVVLSYARENRAGQAQIASPFLGELSRLTGAQLSHLPGQPAPSLDHVASETKLRERVAIELLSPAELRASPPERDRAALRARFHGEPWLARARASARVEEERLRFFSDPELPPGPFTGWTGTPEVRARLAQLLEFGAEQPLSASTLKRFGECAFRGFLALAVGLEEPDVFEEEMDARGKGSFWHRVLEELFRRLQARRLIGRALEEVPAALIDEALEVAASEIEKENHVGHPALWELDRQRARAMVARLLRSEHRGLPFRELSPESAELCFGREGAAASWREVRMPDLGSGPDVFVSGKIDRLDSGLGGVGVVDYKSGIIPNGKQLIENLLETEFQLPLYLYAVSSVAHPTRMEAALLSLRSGKLTNLAEALGQYGDIRIDELISADPEMRRKLQESGRKNLPNAVHTMLRRLRGGEFPIRPRDCSFCSFRPVCRITERRFGEARLE